MNLLQYIQEQNLIKQKEIVFKNIRSNTTIKLCFNRLFVLFGLKLQVLRYFLGT